MRKLAVLLLCVSFCLPVFLQNEEQKGNAVPAESDYIEAARAFSFCIETNTDCLFAFTKF